MKLKSLNIRNYRSIQDLTFEIVPVNGSHTFTLIGINESGKSSFLKALDLIAEDSISYPQDFYDDSEPVIIALNYRLTDDEVKSLKDYLAENFSFDRSLCNRIVVSDIQIETSFEPSPSAARNVSEIITFKEDILSDYTVIGGTVVKKDKTNKELESLNLDNFFTENLEDYFWNLSHSITFWKSSPEYLILDEIDLQRFAQNPREISIPLDNCFDLAHIEDIPKRISKLNSPAAIQNLEELLSNKVTTHINKVWPGHQIKIKFKINNYKLSFLVEDKGVKFKNKTTSQRSDGFRQLISFLLTLSAENQSQFLSNTILLIDEPEIHLHPTAQINLRDELIKLSQNDNNNIVFFATHSNYMIDKENIDRCYQVHKEKNLKTMQARIFNHDTSYSEVNYEVFHIPTNDYHNELYGFLEETHKQKLSNLPKTKKWNNTKRQKAEDVSLPTYIRHSIHHPENTTNKKFTEEELKQSIDTLRTLKYGKI
jgi:predicted ATP-dependent endonuclease of OLD family